MSKFVLIDGHSILNRAFYGVPIFTNSEGLHTNAVFGFLNIMFKIIDSKQPDYMAVAFDVHQPTFRHEMFKDYKGTRKPMMEELREQVPVIKELLQKMNITTVELPGYEADDVIGTLSKKGEKAGMEVDVISGDRDLLQLASDHITICIPKTKKGQTTVEEYNTEGVRKLYKVTPTEFIDVKALMGDSSDNIPGVPGIGEKGATAIISQFGSIENAYDHAEEISNTRNRNALLNNYEMAQMSKTLATINIQSPVEVTPEQCKLEDIYTEDALEMIKRLEFKSMIQRFGSVTSTNDCEGGFKYINNPFDADPIFEQAKNADNIGVFIYRNKDNFGVSLCFNNDNVYYIGKEGFVTEDYIIEKVRDLVNAKAELTILNIKENNDILENDDAESIFDISIAAYLLNPLQNTYDYDDIAREYLGMNVPAFDEIFPKTKKNETPSDEIPENILKYACYNAYVAYKAKDALTEKLKETEMLDIYNNVEIPLTYALYDMEQAGIMVAGDKLKEYGERLKTGIDALEKDIFAEAGHEFNINSPKQLGEILFGEMQLPGGKKTKTGYSTSASVLEKLEPDYPFVSKILEYRQLAKLKSTYADGLAVYIGEDNRIHGKFNQTITATGRISSTEPNLQNIPVRMPLGREIRKVFIPKEGCVFIDADYSQIELRILAHMSDDKNLIDAYNHSKDIHAATASLVFHVPLEEVTKEQRSNAKAVNFGIVYGISSFGLSNDLSISRKEAEQYIKDYFISYPGIKNYLDNSVKEAKEKGYSVTMFGRRRPIPELTSGNFMQRQFGERVAMNSPIQGSAADIMKIAMINVAKELKEKDLKSKIVLQVHDELLIEAYENEVEQVKDILKRNMEQAAHLNVPLDVDVQVGNNWDEAH
ncbi:DNA polymerase I [Eubacterium ventriosum]|uniref:DNA polymerase I n=1 Tax=Eubacterium ventriosum ATCC 27560 TaxID=411463 RepID=A5Z4J5_9FIRM|nr:DNA polymerase I [Eubacterium ventriosum]EDM52094.1 DNA-directed DNA polymerase [Eubacterium ventriosum ATCC 27560]UWP35224.1 DNA polymerase I [Eubacterium ventriosum]